MSLNFNFKDMIDRVGQEEYDRITDHPTEKGKWHPVTDGLIWATMSIDMGSITEKNADKFADRLLAYQQVFGGYLQSRDGKIIITREDVHNHIGLVTNVTTKSDASFYARLFKNALTEAECRVRVQKRTAYDICNNPEPEEA